MTAMRKLLPVLLLAVTPALGQLQTDTITITATRHVSLQPDQLVFQVQVLAPETAGIDDVLVQLAGTGITPANLTGVSSFVKGQFEWEFRLTVPISQAGATVALLLQREVTFYVQGTQVSQALQQSQGCSQASLVSDARAQAQSLAVAAGFTAGPVLAVADGSSPQSPVAAARLGLIPNVLTGAFISVASFVASTPPLTCTAVVKFQLLRYH